MDETPQWTETCESRENWHEMNSESIFRKMPKHPSSSSLAKHRTQSPSQQQHLFFTLWKLKTGTEAKGTLTVKLFFFSRYLQSSRREDTENSVSYILNYIIKSYET